MLKAIVASLRFPVLTIVILAFAPTFGSESNTDAKLAEARATALKTFKMDVVPFIKNYCDRCHGEMKKKGGVTFEYAVKTPSTSTFRPLWKQALENLKSSNMPPEEEDKQPTDQEREKIISWIEGIKYLSPKDPGQFVIRRLNKTEYGNTLHDLFGVDPKVASELPDEVFGAGYTNSVSSLIMEQYLSVANEVLKQSFAPSGAPPTFIQQQLLGPPPSSGQDNLSAARQVTRSLARKAFRRPPSESEIDVLMKVFKLATDNGKSYSDALRLTLKAILVSPQFLFNTPGSEPGAGKEIVPLDDYQLASRLSYLFWGTMPDAELDALADAGILHDRLILAE